MNIAEEYNDTMSRKIKRKFSKLLGKVSLVKPVLDKLNITGIVEETLKDCPIKHTEIENGKACEVMILNRLLAPLPIYKVDDWVDKDTCVGDLYKLKPGCMNDDRIGDLLDNLYPNKNILWSQLITKAITEFKIPFDIIYNDITSIYFEGIYEESQLIEHGYSRDQKPDKKQVNLDIDSNITGIPLVYNVLSGKTSDKTTVIDNMETVIKTLKQSSNGSKRPLMVGDRAMLDDKIAIAYHNRGDIDFLGTLKLTNDMKETIASVKEEDFTLIDTDKDNGLYYGYCTEWTFSYEGKTATDSILIVKSEQKLLHDRNQRDKGIKKFEEVLDDLNSKLNSSRYKKEETVEKRIENLRKEDSYKKYSKFVETVITKTEEDVIQLTYSRKIDLIEKQSLLDGKYIIATNRKDLTPKLMVSIYKARDISEKDFSTIKGPLIIRPIFLHKDERIESLVFLSMCALLVYSIIKQMLIEKEMGITVRKALEQFEYIGVSYYEFMDGSILRIADDLIGKPKSILEKLKIPEPSTYVNQVT